MRRAATTLVLRRHGRTKTLLALLLAIGGISSVTVSGTYALMAAEETNAGSTISSGTLTLGNRVGAGTICFSYGPGSSGNSNQGCAPLLTSSTLQYPGETLSAQLQILDDGSIDGASLSVYMPGCASSTSPGASGHDNGGDACSELTTAGDPSGLQLEIQETYPDWSPKKCWYPVKQVGPCSAASGYAAAAGNSFGIFAEYVTSPASAYDLGKGPAHGETRYFLVSVSLPANASDSLQGRQATFDLTWRLTS